MNNPKNQDAFNLQQTILLMTGIWPVKNSTLMYKLLGLITFGFCSFMNITLLLTSCLNGVDFSQKFEASYMSVDFICYQIKLLIFYFKKDNFLRLLDQLENPLFNSYRADLSVYVEETIKITRWVVKIFFGSSVVTFVAFVLLPVLGHKKTLSLPLPFPLDIADQSKLLYVLIYIIQAMALTVGGVNTVAFDNLASSLMGVVSAQLKILNGTLTAIAEMENLLESAELSMTTDVKNYCICQKLVKCVKHHVAIIKLAESIEEIFKYGYLMQFLTSVVVICFTGFSWANSKPGSSEFLFSISMFGSLLIEIAIGCVYGNDVIIQSARISDACYMSDWTNCDRKMRQILFIIMERSKRPLVLTAGKFVSLSLSSLVGILRSAFSYAAVLRQLYNDG